MENRESSHEEPVVVYVSDDETRVEVVRAALEAEGIETASWSKMAHSAFQFTVEAGETAVLVAPGDEQRARQIIEEAQRAEPGQESPDSN